MDTFYTSKLLIIYDFKENILMNLNIKYYNQSIKTFKTEIYICGFFNKDKINEDLNVLSDNKLKNAINVEKFTGQKDKSILVYANSNIKRILYIGLGNKNEFKENNSRELGAKIAKKINSLKINSISIDLKSFNLNRSSNLSQSFIEGIILGNYQFLNYKTEEKEKNTLNSITIVGNINNTGIEVGQNIANGVNYSRDLGNHPPNILTPTYLANEAKKIAKNKNMKAKIFDVKDFQKMGFGSFYGVAKGSLNVPAKFILVEYTGGKKNDAPIALVGKGLTFDSGGISIKPSPSMDEMKFDMCGSATVMGLMKVVAELQPKINIIFAIGSTENMPDGNAQKPGDIVKAYNGKTIEILNTDAEGRLVLADVLSYVEKNYKPNTILDFATLTGAVLVALGDRASGIMGNNNNLIKEVKSSAEKTNERVWELPLWDEYSKDIKSKIADIKNLGKSRLAGTISAGAFLKEFIDHTPWVHMDIAGTAWGPTEPSYLPKSGATGVGVRLVYNLIQKRIK